MQLRKFILVLSLFFVLFGFQRSYSQQGSLTGTVTDAGLGETMIGVTVQVLGKATGTVTDLEGKYSLRLAPGAYEIRYSYIGYITIAKNITIEANKVLKVDIGLKEDVTTSGTEVVIEASVITETEGAMLRLRQKAAAVSDAISAEAISKSGSSSAADAMTKVTGASVVGGKYVFVRGLGERYSSTHLNGVELPSADPDKKAFNFDLFQSDMLDNITTLKTFTPDKPGNFSGGLVDIGTRKFPDKRMFSLGISSGINTVTHFKDGFLSYSGGKTDWLGKDDGTRAIPDFLSDQNLEVPNAIEARRDALKAQVLDQASKALTNVMAAKAGAAPLKGGFNMALGNQIKIANRPLGYLASLTYDYNTSHRKGTSERYVNPIVGAKELYSTLGFYTDEKSSEEASLGGLLNLSYTISPAHQISVNGLYSRSGESTARYQEGYWFHSFGNDESKVLQNNVLGYTERELRSLQVKGKHVFTGLSSSTLEWSYANALTTQDEPDLRFFVALKSTDEEGRVSYSTNLANVLFPSHYWRALMEGTDTGALDFTLPFKQWGGQKANLKAGALFTAADRDFTERTFLIRPSNTISYDNNPEVYFGNQNSGIVSQRSLTNGSTEYTFGNIVELPRKEAVLRNNYAGDQTIAAAYVMTELPLTSRLRFVGGVRYETTEMTVKSADPALEDAKLSNKDWLPAANFVYQLGEKTNIRAAATRTIARPVFRELSRFSSADFLLGGFLAGNPNLKRTLITNYDLRIENFMRPGEILAVSAFYKDLQNPIERSIYEAGATESLQFVNVEQATILGAEFEARKRLDALGIALENLSVGANISFVKSSITLPEAEYLERKALDPNTKKARPLQGQSPFIVNTDVAYSTGKTTASLYFNVFGDRLTAVSFGNTPDVYERPSPKLDLIVSHGFKNLKLKLAAKNLLDSPYKETYRFLNKDYTYYEYKMGRSLSLSVGYSF